jgi:hypothetical protein
MITKKNYFLFVCLRTKQLFLFDLKGFPIIISSGFLTKGNSMWYETRFSRRETPSLQLPFSNDQNRLGVGELRERSPTPINWHQNFKK